MITVWGRRSSNSVQKVLWCLDELGIAYARNDPALEDPAAYRRINPAGLVPAIRDGDLVLWESNAIVRYLSARYGEGTLWPTDPGIRSLADRWMDWQLGTATPALWPLFRDLVRVGGKPPLPEEIPRSLQEATKLMHLLEEWLNGRAFIAGDNFTMGDIPLGVWAHRWFSLPVDREAMPNLEAWYARLTGRPPYRHHILTGEE